MSINKSDVKLFKSQILTDADNAGGRMSANEVIDGQANNLYPDVSRLDRVYGRVNLRKIFAGVSTADTEPWLGAHAVLLAPAQNPKVRALLFSTDSAFDTRTDARDRMESYLAQGGETGWLLYGKHYKGQRTIQLLARTIDTLPQVGFTYVMLDNDGADSGTTEYVRAYGITVIEKSFTTYENGGERNFKRNVITLDIGIPLSRDWDGNEALYFYNAATTPTKIIATLIADAARYYNASKVATAVSADTRSVQLESIFENLVPATRSETPMLDLRAAGDAVTMQAAASSPVVVTSSQYTAPSGYETRNFYFAGGTAPGSVTVLLYRSGNPSGRGIEIKDDGNGGFYQSLGPNNGGNRIDVDFTVSTINYDTGNIVIRLFALNPDVYSVAARITATPAVAYTDVGFSQATAITQANRQYNYARNLLPLPTPGTVSVNYRALGVWYRLRDINGDGELVPDVGGTGTGTINYTTGAVNLTAAALPDDGSAVIWQWAAGVSLKRRDGVDATFSKMGIEHTLASAVKPGSLTVSFVSGGATKTLTESGTGVLSGSGGAGYVYYGAGLIKLEPDPLPDVGAQITFAYDKYTPVHDVLTATAGATAAFTLASTPVKPGTVSIVLPVDTGISGFLLADTRTYTDDGLGNLRFIKGWSAGVATYVTAGTIDYSSGACSIDASVVS